jgi:hypothetical protein
VITGRDVEAERFAKIVVESLDTCSGKFRRIATLGADEKARVVFVTRVVATNEGVETADAVHDAKIQQEV